MLEILVIVKQKTYPFVQIDEEIQRIDDENFVWLINHYANPQGGLELFDRITHLDLNH